MGEQIRAEDWLPEGWKVEIRVRKSGKKDRYYIDPTNGYIFRSLKDIDRYLLTGKLGRHVTKTKPKDSENSVVKRECKTLLLQQVVSKSKEKKQVKSNGTKKPSSVARVQKQAESSSQKLSAKTSKKEDRRVENSEETPKKKISRPSPKKTSKPSRKREATPFFILDPDHCDEGKDSSIPNLSEIIDSVQKEQEGHNAVYISAPAIGALLRRQLPETRPEHYHKKQKPQFSLTMYKDYTSHLPSMFSMFHQTTDGLQSNMGTSPIQNQNPSSDLEKSSRMVDIQSKVNEEPEIGQPFVDLLTDPCIDFAIKTLTGALPLGGSDQGGEDCYFQQQLCQN